MTSTAQEAMADVLAEGGFIQNGRRSSGLIDSETARKSVNADLRYGRLLTSTTETSSVDLVYEVPNQIEGAPGTPSIYFKFLDHQPAADTFIKLRTSVWNQGRVPTLWIITPDTIRIYDSFARPQANDTEDSHLLDILARVGSQLKHLRDIEALHKGSFDSGAFWQSLYGRKIEREQRVDISMLTDLSKTVEILTTPTLIAPAKVLEASIAHALLGRAIFISYLLDRSILNSSIFKEYHYNSFKELLNDKEATYKFFRWFRNTFNGDLFPLRVGEENTVDIVHLQVIQQLFAGTDMHAYPVTQQRLWPYQFDIIPIELISSIYEMFAHNLNSKAAEERSVHYTRLGLVELVLSLAMRNITYTARVLDPACGSGVFLVEAFRRLAWLRAKEYGRPLGHDELQEILRTQIFGIDIDPDAVNVAAFSLYLALLELEFDPQHGWFKFPHLLYTTSAATQSPNLYVQDFCNIDHAFNHMPPFVDKGFDIIVGNPPWTALKAETAPRDPDDPEHGSQWGLKYCVRNEIPDNKPDQAFLMRARDFATEKTRIAFIVCSRVFYQQEDRSWLNRFLETNTVDIVVNFSDLVGENILFGGQTSTRLPASAILFHIANPPLNHKLMYLTPRWYPNIKRQDQITITSDDIHYLSQKVVKQKPFLWKSAFRGIARDYRLLNRLQEYPSLKQVLVDAGIDELAHRGITFGQGTQKPTPGSLLGKPFFPSGSVARYGIDITNLEPFTRPTIARRSNTKSLRLPALIISRSLRNN
ncbi:MAG: N-6 DNA methylase [Chloroflexota bacterium]|nr:N-6 DNA methylase [Chloroflexota bacterium]